MPETRKGMEEKKIEKKKEKNLQAVSRVSSASLASLIWLKGNRTVASHGQAKRDIEHRLHGTCLF